MWQVRDDLAFTGADGIGVAIERQWATTLRGHHWTSNASVDLGDDRVSATARFDVRSEIQVLDESWLSIAGAYCDTYVKADGEWKLSRRAAEVHSQRRV